MVAFLYINIILSETKFPIDNTSGIIVKSTTVPGNLEAFSPPERVGAHPVILEDGKTV